MRKFASVVLLATAFVGIAPLAQAERLKDLATIAGVRQNQLSGYGIVVGLDGTGDQTRCCNRRASTCRPAPSCN